MSVKSNKVGYARTGQSLRSALDYCWVQSLQSLQSLQFCGGRGDAAVNRPLVRFPLRAISTVSLRKWLKWSLAAVFLIALVIATHLVRLKSKPPGFRRAICPSWGAMSLLRSLMARAIASGSSERPLRRVSRLRVAAVLRTTPHCARFCGRLAGARFRWSRQRDRRRNWLDDPGTRRAYLTAFADQKSRVYMHRFYAKYRGKTPDKALVILLYDVRKSPPKVATVLRSVAPDERQVWFDAQMRTALKRTPAATLSSDDLAKLYTKYDLDKFSLNDRGYIARIHPLELWTVNYLRDHPLGTESQLQDASRAVRFTAYSWLFKTRYHATQDRRIKRMVELQALAEIGKSWRALDYPFATLTSSYVAAIGASGDRPLAQLVGMIANGGKMVPTQTFAELEFAKGAPYEAHFTRAMTPPRTALLPETVDVVHGLLRDVVLGGTEKRLAAGMTFPGEQTLDVYGKTGTGDQRFNVFARGARLIESRKVNRSATFVFVIGDRFFDTLTPMYMSQV